MPNLFPEGGSGPQYNTADAALLFLNCVWLYYEATGNEMFVREMYPVMERIVDAYIRGTAYGIHMDPDGLIMAGEGLAQVTGPVTFCRRRATANRWRLMRTGTMRCGSWNAFSVSRNTGRRRGTAEGRKESGAP